MRCVRRVYYSTPIGCPIEDDPFLHSDLHLVQGARGPCEARAQTHRECDNDRSDSYEVNDLFFFPVIHHP
jgi:hypothetical protein